MVRGTRPLWRLYDRFGVVLDSFYGEYIDAMVQAEAWCEKRG